ncbi:MAG: hypothetical protein B7X95_04710 [Methylophilaceae bacterium 17-44-8]|jgi:hypothetical protein|nr:MAG: hypothetical protein B7Y48_09940 [Methylophilales bacterium 28-44-11]OZA05941.1 MAG: hypothetical protein B7X95_04710 [Methylophilaceae bacterium 17-44-8]
MDNTVFGFTEAQITEFGLTYGVGGLMLLMIFIVAHLAWKCKAGKTGTFILFLALTFGLLGFVAKFVIQSYLNIK